MVAALTLLAALASVFTVNVSGGLVTIAMMSYEGIAQLAPALFFGIFWRRGTALAATAGMISGVVVAVTTYFFYPVSVPWLGGVVPGVAGLLVNALVYVVISLTRPNSAEEQHRLDSLFAQISRTHSSSRDATTAERITT